MIKGKHTIGIVENYPDMYEDWKAFYERVGITRDSDDFKKMVRAMGMLSPEMDLINEAKVLTYVTIGGIKFPEGYTTKGGLELHNLVKECHPWIEDVMMKTLTLVNASGVTTIVSNEPPPQYVKLGVEASVTFSDGERMSCRSEMYVKPSDFYLIQDANGEAHSRTKKELTAIAPDDSDMVLDEDYSGPYKGVYSSGFTVYRYHSQKRLTKVSSNLRFGLEVEKVVVGKPNTMKLKQFIPETDTSIRTQDVGESGVEFVSHVQNLDDIESNKQLWEELEYILSHSAKPTDGQKCGGHIHVSSGLKPAVLIANESKYYSILLAAIYPSRRSNSYCSIKQDCGVDGRYSSIALSSNDTVEFRVFPQVESVADTKWRLQLIKYILENPLTKVNRKTACIKILTKLLSSRTTLGKLLKAGGKNQAEVLANFSIAAGYGETDQNNYVKLVDTYVTEHKAKRKLKVTMKPKFRIQETN